MIQDSNRQEDDEAKTALQLHNILGRITESVALSAGRVREIAAATHEQAGAAEQMACNVEDIAPMSEDIKTAAVDGNRSAQALRELAGQLQTQIDKFKV